MPAGSRLGTTAIQASDAFSELPFSMSQAHLRERNLPKLPKTDNIIHLMTLYMIPLRSTGVVTNMFTIRGLSPAGGIASLVCHFF